MVPALSSVVPRARASLGVKSLLFCFPAAGLSTRLRGRGRHALIEPFPTAAGQLRDPRAMGGAGAGTHCSFASYGTGQLLTTPWAVSKPVANMLMSSS